MKHDIVYVLRSGENEELRYSIRSVVENFPYNRIWLYGGRPKDIRSDGGVFYHQSENTPWNRTRASIELACWNGKITPDFWLFNDDFFVMRKQAEPVNYTNGLLKDRIASHEATHGLNIYAEALKTAYKMLQTIEPSVEPLNYETHTPMLINREKMRNAIENYPQVSMVRSLYGNLYKIYAVDRNDCKNPAVITSAEDYLSTSDDSFKTGLIGQIIRESFKAPTKYEV